MDVDVVLAHAGLPHARLIQIVRRVSLGGPLRTAACTVSTACSMMSTRSSGVPRQRFCKSFIAAGDAQF